MTVALEGVVDADLRFRLYDPNTDSIVEQCFDDYRGKFLIVFFYPADFTFVCPTELKDLHAVLGDIVSSDADILVVSTDTVYSHKRWVETEVLLSGFGIKMVSDRTGALSRYFGVLNSTTGNSERATFIISPDMVVRSIEVVTEPIGRSSIELLRKLRALQFIRKHPGHACPASWNIGATTLQPSVDLAGRVGDTYDRG